MDYPVQPICKLNFNSRTPSRGATTNLNGRLPFEATTTHAPLTGERPIDCPVLPICTLNVNSRPQKRERRRIASRYLLRILENLFTYDNSLANLYNPRNPHRAGLCQIPAKIEEQIGEKYTANRDSCMKKGTPTRRQGRLLGSFSCLPAADTSSSVLPRRPTRC